METEPHASDDLTGHIVAHCVLLERLNPGGMGCVYRAQDTHTKEFVAVKVLPSILAQDEEFIRKFWIEGTTLASCHHPNIVQLRDFGYDDRGRQYIIMEFVEGANIRSLVNNLGPLKVDLALRVTEHTLAALDYAHKRNIVHQDLKPDHIILRSDGVAKIVDFGIARNPDWDTDLTSYNAETVFLGTPSYMSPEQCDGGFVDGRSDLYSLGATLFYMVTGTYCFKGHSPLSVMLKQKFEPPKDPRTYNPTLPGEVARLILWLLAKRRERRPASAAEVMRVVRIIRQSLSG